MDAKICLDTDICISILRKDAIYRTILEKIYSLDTYITTVTLFELFLRKTNVYEIENFIMDLDVLTFDIRAARKSSHIQKELKAKGRPIEIRDLFIASTAIVNNCTLATLNKKHFENIKELKLFDLNFKK